MRMVKVQMMEKSENATRQSRSTTAAANFHSLQIASASSWSRNRWAMYITSARMRWISCSPAYTLTASRCSSFGDPPTRPPPQDTPESLLGGQQALSMEWYPKYRFMWPLVVELVEDGWPGITPIWMLLALAWCAGEWSYLELALRSSPGFFMRKNQAHQLSRITRT